MTGVHNPLTFAQSDDNAEVVSAKSGHIVLDRCSPDNVKKVSRYLECSEGESQRDKECNESAEADSDSGDSLFITQKQVPEAVRSRRRSPYSLGSDPKSHSDLEESEGVNPSSTSFEGSKTDKAKRRKKYRLPKYSFPFHLRRKLPVQHNRSLHNFAIGGFFKCVRELWQDDQSEESSLRTVDMEGDYISPLSEEEEERSEDEDIKVVERKYFVALSKAKSRQTWCSQSKHQRRSNAGNAREETSQGGQCKTLDQIPAEASILRVTPSALDTESTDHGEFPCSVLDESTGNDELVTSNFLSQKETPKTKRRHPRGSTKTLFQQKSREEELCGDNDATVCEPQELQRSPRQHTQPATEPQTDVSHLDNLPQTGQTEDEPESPNLLHSLPHLISDIYNDSVCSGSRGKKSEDRDHESVQEEEQGESQEEPEGLHAAKSVDVEAEETPRLSEDNRAEPPASQTSDEQESNKQSSSHYDTKVRQERRDIPDSERKKKKRKKPAAENVRQESDRNVDSDVRMKDSVFSVSCDVDNGGKKKKKKRSDEDVEQFQCSAALNDDAEIQMKKKKREKIVVVEECEEEETSNMTLDLPSMSKRLEEVSGNTAALEETSQSCSVKRKRHKKEQHAASIDAPQDGQEGVDVSFSNDAVTLEESTGMSLKKKKKKKKLISKEVGFSYTTEENKKVEDVDGSLKTKEGLKGQNAELVPKKKKKKKSEISSRNVSEVSGAQSDDSVSVRKKQKKRTSSFLVADAEEKDAQTHAEQISASRSADAHVWGAEKPSVSASDFETGSAEIAGNLEESNDGVRKKKKKRKKKTSVEQDGGLEEPSKTCQSAVPETSNTGAKRKEKRESVERSDSAADSRLSPTDEDVVLKKKKKNKCKDKPGDVMKEYPPTAADDNESGKSTLNTHSFVSHKKKGKHSSSPLVAKGEHGRSADVSHDGSTSDQVTVETLNMVAQASPSSGTPWNQALDDERDSQKKKKMKSTDYILLEVKSFANTAELEPRETKKKKKERNERSAAFSIPMLSEPEMSSSGSIVKKTKHKKVKRRLHNPNEDFITDGTC